MPWKTTADVARHNKKAAASKSGGSLWRKVANERLKATGDDALAIREANAVVARKDRQ